MDINKLYNCCPICDSRLKWPYVDKETNEEARECPYCNYSRRKPTIKLGNFAEEIFGKREKMK